MQMIHTFTRQSSTTGNTTIGDTVKNKAGNWCQLATCNSFSDELHSYQSHHDEEHNNKLVLQELPLWKVLLMFFVTESNPQLCITFIFVFCKAVPRFPHSDAQASSLLEF